MNLFQTWQFEIIKGCFILEFTYARITLHLNYSVFILARFFLIFFKRDGVCPHEEFSIQINQFVLFRETCKVN